MKTNVADGQYGVIFRRTPGIVDRLVAGENVLVPVTGEVTEARRIYALNDVGAAIWKSFDGTATLEAIRDRLLDRFDVPRADLERELTRFVELLAADGLLEKVG